MRCAAAARLLGLICTVTLGPHAAAAQEYVAAVCSDHFRGVGAPAMRQTRAEQNAIDAWNALARNTHGAGTGFTFEVGLRMGRVKLSCSSRAGRETCTASGRACAWETTGQPNDHVLAACPEGYVLDAERRICAASRYGDRKPSVARDTSDLLCPTGYSLEPSPGRQPRCLRN